MSTLSILPKGGRSPHAEPPRMRVLRWIERSIESGALAPGEAIPSERALAEKFGVARNTAAAAMDEAERRRLVVRRSPAARKRYVPGVGAGFPGIAESTVVVMGEANPFAGGSAEAPRWSDRFISMSLLSRLTHAGKHVMVLSHDALTGRDVEELFVSRPAGLIVTSTIGEHILARRALEICRRIGMPVVVYGDAPELRAFDRVHVDHRAGSRQITEWLLARGRRAIVPFFPRRALTGWAQNRLLGYANAMRAANLSPRPCVSFDAPEFGSSGTEEQFRVCRALAIAKLLDLRRATKFDALLCISDHWAKVAISALKCIGLAPGRDVLVAGYDNGDPDPEFDPFEPDRAVVTIDKHNERTADEMAELLIARMEGRLPPRPQCRTHAHELVVRE